MGEVDDAQRAEHQRQPKRNQRIGRALIQAIEELQEDHVEHAEVPNQKSSVALTVSLSNHEGVARGRS